MKIFSVCPKSFASNTYLLVSGNKALVVDPSVSVAKMQELLAAQGAELCGILLTHGHFDHTVSVDILRDMTPIPLIMHSGDAPMLTDGRIDGFYDFYGRESKHRQAERLVTDGEKISLGDETITVLSTPGHSPGSVCYICPDGDGKCFIVTGDTLFADNVGRCDLWHGDERALIRSLECLGQYNRDSVIYPGHGPSSTLGAAMDIVAYYIDF